MTLKLLPLHPHFGAKATGLDLRQPLSAVAVADINTAMERFAVLVFRAQPLDQDQQVNLAKSFGPLDLGLKKIVMKSNVPKPAGRFKYDELLDISNVDASGKVDGKNDRLKLSNLANQFWHSDSSFQKPSATYSMLSAVVVPPSGGQTEFADLRVAYETLPDDLKAEIQDLVGEHFALHSRLMLGASHTEEEMRAFAPVQWPLVRTCPGSNRKALFVGAHISRILGLSVPEGRTLVADLLEHATQREFVYRHEWQAGDLIIWDNRTTIHRGRRYDLSQRRELRRTTIEDRAAAA